MTDNGGFIYLEMIEQTRGVGGQQIEAVGDAGLAGFSEADLIRHDDAESRFGQSFGRRSVSFPVKVHPMEDDDGLLSVPLKVEIESGLNWEEMRPEH